MSKCTPGPWRAGPGGRILAPEPQTVLVCRVGAYDDPDLLPYCRERWQADARLIAAAPELLNALERLFDEYEDRRAQFCEDPLWKKWERVEVFEEAGRLLDELKGDKT